MTMGIEEKRIGQTNTFCTSIYPDSTRRPRVPALLGGLDVLLRAKQCATLRFEKDVVPKIAKCGKQWKG